MFLVDMSKFIDRDVFQNGIQKLPILRIAFKLLHRKFFPTDLNEIIKLVLCTFIYHSDTGLTTRLRFPYTIQASGPSTPALGHSKTIFVNFT